jgi:hypothetical protein
MSGSKRIFGFIIALLLALGFYSTVAQADVTGSFGINISLNSIDCMDVAIYSTQTQVVRLGDQPCESTVFKIDFETDLNVNVAISGLTMGLHSHAGVTGLEDVILSFAATLGALDVEDEFVFAQPFKWLVAGDGQVIPACVEDEVGSGECDILFVKKRVEASISLGGVTFSNLAIIEDTTFPNPCLAGSVADGCLESLFGNAYKVFKAQTESYQAGNQTFGFGDVVTIEGQTPSGITIKGITGICASSGTNRIKKHSWKYTVNPDCIPGFARVNQVTFTNSIQSGSTVPTTTPTPVVKTVGRTEVTETVKYTAAGTKWAVGDKVTKTFSFRLIDLTDPVGDELFFTLVSRTDRANVGGTCLNYTAANTLKLTPSSPTASCTVVITIGSSGTTTTASATVAITSLMSETVNKPPLLFDFESLSIEGIPLAAGFTLDLEILCATPSLACKFEPTLKVEGPPLFPDIVVDFEFTNIAGPFSFEGGTVTIPSGPLTVVLAFDGTLAWKLVQATLSFTLNPDTNPATLSIELISNTWAIYGTPADIDSASFGLSVSRAGLDLSATADFSVSAGTYTFDTLTLSLGAEAGIISFDADIKASATGFRGANLGVEVSF